MPPCETPSSSVEPQPGGSEVSKESVPVRLIMRCAATLVVPSAKRTAPRPEEFSQPAPRPALSLPQGQAPALPSP